MKTQSSPPNDKKSKKSKRKVISDIKGTYLDENKKVRMDILDILLKKENPLKKLNKLDESPIFISSCIQYCLIIRPKEINKFLNILLLYSVKHGCNNYICDYIRDIFIYKGIIPGVSEYNSFEDIINIFPKGSIEEAIMNDDSETFVKLIKEKGNDINYLYYVNNKSPLFTITGNSLIRTYITRKEAFYNAHKRISYIQLIAFFNSVNCFKAALEIGKCSLRELAIYAVAGGSTSIINYLAKEGIKFGGCLEASIRYHRTNISDWIIQNYKCETISFSKAIEAFNLRALSYLLETNKDPEVNIVNQAFNSSVRIGNLNLTIYFAGWAENKLNTAIFTAFNSAIEYDYFDIIKYLVEECKVNVDDIMDDSGTALRKVCIVRNLPIASYLVNECKADIKNITNMCLINAVKDGDFPFIKFLCETCKMDPSKEEKGKISAIFTACESNDLEIIKYLIEKCNSASEMTNKEGNTILQKACLDRNLEFVKYLVRECKVNVEKRSRQGKTALYTAIYANDLDIVKYLIEEGNADINTIPKNSISIAAKNNNLELIKYLCEKWKIMEFIPDCFSEAIHSAAKVNNLDIIKYLIENYHAEFNSGDFMGSNEEIKKYLNEKTFLHKACKEGMIQKVKSLVEEKNYNVEQRVDGVTPLHAASEANNLPIVQYLVEECHANTEEISDSALIIAVSKNDFKFIDYLCKKCNVNVNKVAEYNRLIKTDLPLQQAISDQNLPMIKYLVEEYHADANIESYPTSLYLACKLGNLEIVKYLVKTAHAIVNTDPDEKAPLSVASKRGYLDIIKFLIEEAHANKENINKLALYNATANENIELIKYLTIKCKVEDKFVDVFNNEENRTTALYLALTNENKEIIKILIDYGRTPIYRNLIKKASTKLDLFKFFVKEIHKNPDISYFSKYDYEEALYVAASRGNLELVKYIINEYFLKYKDNEFNKNDILRVALKNNDLKLIKYLIEELHTDFYCYRYDSLKEEIKQYFIERSKLAKACEDGDLNTVKKLIEEEHYSVNQKFQDEPPLMIAIKKNNLQLVKYLVYECHADTQAYCNSLLFFASKVGDFELVKSMIEENNARVENIDNMSIIEAIKSGRFEYFKYLVEKCHIYVKSIEEFDGVLATENDHERKKKRTLVTKEGLLHVACKYENLEIIKYLIEELHFDVEEKTQFYDKWSDAYLDQTALHIACAKGNIPIIKFLIEECHADTSSKDRNGWSALHFASFNCNLDAVKYLVEVCHMRVDEEDNIGRTALLLSQENFSPLSSQFTNETNQNEREEVIEYLQQHLSSK